MVDPIVWSLLALLVGALARIFVPFLKERMNNPDLSWEWKYVRGPVLAFFIVCLLLPLLVSDIANVLRETNLQIIWLVGWGIGDIGRTLDK